MRIKTIPTKQMNDGRRRRRKGGGGRRRKGGGRDDECKQSESTETVNQMN